MTETYSVSVQEDPKTKDLFFELPSSLIEGLGWQPGDDLKWDETDDGGFRLTRVKMETVELDLDDEELFKYMQLAHEKNITFNQFVEEALTDVIESEEKKNG
jgi:hypothetical protein